MGNPSLNRTHYSRRLHVEKTQETTSMAAKRVLYSLCTVLLICPLPAAQSRHTPTKTTSVFPNDCWGVYSWCSWNTKKVTQETCPLIKGAPIVMHWNKIEPEPGVFTFDEQLGDKLQLALDNNFYTFVMIWVAPNAPRWLYENGVPELQMTPTVSPRREPRNWTFQYYLDEDYIRYYYRLIRTFGNYIRELPPNLQERILYVQSAEGSTGDGFCYKGEPLEEEYKISRDQWSQFRLQAWEVFKDALSDSNDHMAKPLLVNYDSNREVEYNWLLQNLEVIGLKNGMFSHGYHISDTQQRLENWRQFVSDVSDLGKTFFSRGEQDAEWQVCGWSSRNTQQALYWSAVFATHCGLDMWNLPQDACQGNAYALAINFFNTYAGYHNASLSPAAFCALRKGLDAADTVAYPESIYGKAKKSNVDRYLRIAEAYSHHGAIQGDPEKAIGGGMKNRQRDNYNDVGWKILPGNYYRYLTQIDADRTSAGSWHVGPEKSIYGRFARGFDFVTGKTEMFFHLDSKFFPDNEVPHQVAIKVTYLDQGQGQWALCYNDGSSKTEARRVRCQNSGDWKTIIIHLDDAYFNRGLERRSDMTIKHISADDTLFHMIEIERK